MFCCSLDWSLYTSCYLYVVDRLYKHPNKKVDYVQYHKNNVQIAAVSSRDQSLAKQVVGEQLRALLVATVGDFIHQKRRRTNYYFKHNIRLQGL